MDCPFCGGYVTRAEISSSAGKRELSLCCGKSLKLIDEYTMLEGLPGEMMQMAVDAEETRLAQIAQAEKENVEGFRASKAAWYESEYYHVFED